MGSHPSWVFASLAENLGLALFDRGIGEIVYALLGGQQVSSTAVSH